MNKQNLQYMNIKQQYQHTHETDTVATPQQSISEKPYEIKVYVKYREKNKTIYKLINILKQRENK